MTLTPDPLSRSGLSLDRLRSFLAIAEAGGIARAAPRSPTRQSQLSRQLAELETFFETALAERRGRSIALTPAGERLAVVVREALDGIRDLATAGPHRAITVSLGAGDSVLHGWILPRIGQALDETKETALQLVAMSSPAITTQLLDARLDFGVVRAKDVTTGLRSRPIGTIAYALYVPHALRPKRGASEADLLASVPLAAQHGDPELAEHLRASAARLGVALAPRLLCETFPQAERAMRSGSFAAVLPELAEKPPATDVIRSPLFGPTTKLHLAWSARLERRRPGAAVMVEPLVRAFTREDRSGPEGGYHRRERRS